MAKGRSVERRSATAATRSRSDEKSKGDSRQATTPIPVMTDDESKASTARDFNITSGQQRSGAEADKDTHVGVTDVGTVGGKEVKGRRKRGEEGVVGESEVATSDAGTPALLTEQSEGTSATSGEETEITEESEGTAGKRRAKKPGED
jgi:hypothetical protein